MDDPTYEHYTYFPTQAAAQAFAADVQQRGVLVEEPRPAATGTDWLVMTYTAFSDRSAWADAFSEAAERLGGEYDGGGSYVGPPPTPAGPPVPPSATPSSAAAAPDEPRPVEPPSPTAGPGPHGESLWSRVRGWFG